MTAPFRPDRPSGRTDQRNPESSALVTAYRRTIPLTARRALAGRFPAQLRASVKRSLTSPQALTERFADLRAERARQRRPDLFSGPERRLVQVSGLPRVALVRDYPAPLQAQLDALRFVLEALTEADIRHFCVRGTNAAVLSVGVAEPDRPRVLRALTALCERTAGYLAVREGPLSGLRRGIVPGVSPAARRHLSIAPVVRLHWYFTDRHGASATSQRYGCAVEFWQPEPDGTLTAPRRNKYVDEIPAEEDTVPVPLTRITQLLPAQDDGPDRAPVRAQFARPLSEDVTYPIDAVYTWVDGSDPSWLERRAQHSGVTYHAEADNAARFLSRDELRYSLRSLHQYAPWVRHVYLVTDDQTPSWLDTEHPDITVVSHRDIFTDTTLLPTFNSHAIESQLHHIEGLADHFLYLNDDVFFGRLTVPQNFFLGNGLTRFFLSKAHIPYGQPSDDDVPVSVAAKNNRTALEERFGTVITQKMKHVPHPLNRTVLYEIEKEFNDRHQATASNRFRALNDLSVTSSLHHYYAFQTGRAVPSSIRYDYFDLAHPHTETRLGRLLGSRNRMVFCLNDTVSDEAEMAEQADLLGSFLRAYFPFASPFERQE